MKIIAGGVMRTWSATQSWHGRVMVVGYVGLVDNCTVHEHWLGRTDQSAVTVFDLRRVITLYTGPPSGPQILVAQQNVSAAIVCAATDYKMFDRRVTTLRAMGVQRTLFLSLDLALEWAAQEAAAIAPRPPRKLAA